MILVAFEFEMLHIKFNAIGQLVPDLKFFTIYGQAGKVNHVT